MEELRKAIAVDFDGCLCSNNWPDVGEPNWPVIEAAKREKENGAALILWTCRNEEDTQKAVEACREWGLEFDAVNENLSERVEAWNNDCRKVGADEYWDDRAVHKEFGVEPVRVCKLDDFKKLLDGVKKIARKYDADLPDRDVAFSGKHLQMMLNAFTQHSYEAVLLDTGKDDKPDKDLGEES